jgi:hypothetical protein
VGATENSEGFRETLSEVRQKEPRRVKMAGKKEAKQKADPCDRTEKNKEKSSGEPEKEPRRDPEGQGRPKKGVKPCRGGEEAVADKKASLTKRRQVRKVATMI